MIAMEFSRRIILVVASDVSLLLSRTITIASVALAKC